MTEELHELIIRAANGNQEAFEFIVLWHDVCHGIDDVVDEKTLNSEKKIDSFNSIFRLCEHPFYKKYSQTLYPIIVLTSNAYADSTMTNMPEYQKDTLRFFGNELVFLTAFICGGYKLMRELSSEFRLLSDKEHHNINNEPI